jgi:hypothetical protein
MPCAQNDYQAAKLNESHTILLVQPPAGVQVNEAGGQYYNPYFPGGKIGMAKQVINRSVL